MTAELSSYRHTTASLLVQHKPLFLLTPVQPLTVPTCLGNTITQKSLVILRTYMEESVMGIMTMVWWTNTPSKDVYNSFMQGFLYGQTLPSHVK